MSVEQAQIIPGVYSRVMNFDWFYTDQSNMSAVFIISSKNAVINNDIGYLEDIDLHLQKNRLERITLIQRLNNFHLNHLIYMDRNERVGEEIEFEY